MTSSVYILALLSSLSFALGIQFFTHFSRKISPVWVNAFKGCIALLGFLITALISGGFAPIKAQYIAVFFVSGFIGLGLADIFLLTSFSLMGPGRAMVIYGFHPMILAILSLIFFNQQMDVQKLTAIILFMLCVFIFSLESFKTKGHWNLKATAFALLAVTIDAAGVILSRYAFNSTGIPSIEANFYRACGAVFLFIILTRIMPYNFIANLKKLSAKHIALMIAGSILGAYLALVLYLEAVKRAPYLAGVSGISVSCTIFASAFECILHKKLPSKYLIASLAIFLLAMKILFSS